MVIDTMLMNLQYGLTEPSREQVTFNRALVLPSARSLTVARVLEAEGVGATTGGGPEGSISEVHLLI